VKYRFTFTWKSQYFTDIYAMMIFIIVILTGDSSQNLSEYKNMTATVSTYIMLICACKDNNVLWLTVYKTITSVLKISTYIITSITFRHIGLAAILVIMSDMPLFYLYHGDYYFATSLQSKISLSVKQWRASSFWERLSHTNKIVKYVL
jgi:hypothetical protein